MVVYSPSNSEIRQTKIFVDVHIEATNAKDYNSDRRNFLNTKQQRNRYMNKIAL
jgi:hypothetical protein